jgi:hypothetical protein
MINNIELVSLIIVNVLIVGTLVYLYYIDRNNKN